LFLNYPDEKPRLVMIIVRLLVHIGAPHIFGFFFLDVVMVEVVELLLRLFFLIIDLNMPLPGFLEDWYATPMVWFLDRTNLILKLFELKILAAVFEVGG
jgi:hypothetical protein